MKILIVKFLIASSLVLFLQACQKTGDENGLPNTPSPIVAGDGEGSFSIGELLYSTKFDDPENWELQIQKSNSTTQEYAEFKNGILDAYMPDRGCTAWLRREFKGSITIIYNVICPEETLTDPGIQARDINNFWHASDLSNSTGLFDSKRYTGEFSSYNKMNGYYASTGGGHDIGNKTTRFRRYPRDKHNFPTAHIALNDRDENPDYLITPGKWHTVQLVVFNGFVQYIVDGKIVYEIKEGDSISIENEDRPSIQKIYALEEFPPHTHGYIGLRMVRTHHKYTNFSVYRLNPN